MSDGASRDEYAEGLHRVLDAIPVPMTTARELAIQTQLAAQGGAIDPALALYVAGMAVHYAALTAGKDPAEVIFDLRQAL